MLLSLPRFSFFYSIEKGLMLCSLNHNTTFYRVWPKPSQPFPGGLHILSHGGGFQRTRARPCNGYSQSLGSWGCESRCDGFASTASGELEMPKAVVLQIFSDLVDVNEIHKTSFL